MEGEVEKVDRFMKEQVTPTPSQISTPSLYRKRQKSKDIF